MKKLLIVSLGLFICAVATNYSSAMLVDPQVAGIWLFEEGKGDVAKDSSGNKNDGKLNGGVTWTKDGKFGGALEFDGIDDWVEVPDSESVEFPKGTDFTLACWLKVTTPEPSPPMIIAKHYHTTQQALPWYALYYADQNKSATGYISLFLRDTASANYFITSTSKIDDGDWHHIVGTRERGTISLYVDGVKEAEMGGADVDVGTNDKPLHFMSHYDRFMGGVLDEVAIFRRALSDAEILNLMNNGISKALSVSALDKMPSTWAQIKSSKY